MLGLCRCKNPQRVPPDALTCLHARNRAEAGGGRSKLRGAGRIAGDCGTAKRVRGGRAKPGQGCRERTLEGTTPREPPAVDVLNPRPVARDSRKDKPRNRGPQGRPPASVGGVTCGRNGRWAHRCGNAPVAFREEKAPKGESQERSRREKKPARDRREETVERVAKP